MRPGSSVVRSTLSVVTVSTETSAGGGAAGFAASLLQPVSKAARDSVRSRGGVSEKGAFIGGRLNQAARNPAAQKAISFLICSSSSVLASPAGRNRSLVRCQWWSAP